MKRGFVLGVLVGIGGLAMGVSAVVHAQRGTPQITAVDKIKDNLFVLRGGGGNTAVFITTDGVVVVDAKNPGYGQPILDEIKKLTPKPITVLINTHTHGDHVSGNVDFPATVDIVVQENTKVNMEKMDIFKTSNNRGMAKRTFKDKLTIGRGADQVDLFFFGPGHTNGDAWVHFPALRTVHSGDIFANKALPNIDADNGGSTLYYAETLKKAHDTIKNVDVVITGHAPATMTWDDLKTFAEFNDDFRTWAEAELKAGKTPEQAAAAWKMPEKYTGYSTNVPTLFRGLPGRIQLLSEELKKR
jgi:glyoxylase-like metal-dependent hydrolase (beta-lactamase superfamily II)